MKIVYTLYLTKLNRNKYLTLVPTNGSKEKIKKYEDLQIKIRDLIGSLTKNYMIMMENV